MHMEDVESFGGNGESLELTYQAGVCLAADRWALPLPVGSVPYLSNSAVAVGSAL